MILKNLGLLSLFLQLITSCSSIKFISNGTIPVFYHDRNDHQTIYTSEGKKEAFFWGLVAPDNTVILDQVFADQGAVSVADIYVEVTQTRGDWLSTVFSFGLYVPKHYKVFGRVRR